FAKRAPDARRRRTTRCGTLCETRTEFALPNLPRSERDYRRLVALLFFSAFSVAGGIHYQTPMLAAIAADFHADAATVGWIPTLSFGGLLAGIVLFVPLGDRVDKRTLVLSKAIVMLAAQATMVV